MTTPWWKEERGEKVFIDYNENARDRTITCAYSVRRRADADVTAPVTWDELPDVETETSHVTMPKRFAKLGDVQAGIDDTVCASASCRNGLSARRRQGSASAVPAELPEDARRAARVQPSRARAQDDDAG